MSAARLNRREVVGRLLANRGDGLVIAGLGQPAWDITAAGDSDLSFPLWGAMGGAVPMGLGLALARPDRRVLVITGDGEMLMGIGALATVASQNPKNLAIVTLDNEQYGETGRQPTHTGRGTDLAAMAQGAGIAEALTVGDAGGLDRLCQRVFSGPGPLFAAIKVGDAPEPLVLPPRDGVWLKLRFRQALLGGDRTAGS